MSGSAKQAKSGAFAQTARRTQRIRSLGVAGRAGTRLRGLHLLLQRSLGSHHRGLHAVNWCADAQRKPPRFRCDSSYIRAGPISSQELQL